MGATCISEEQSQFNKAFEAASKQLDQKAASHILRAGSAVDHFKVSYHEKPEEQMRMIVYAARYNLPHLFSACLRKQSAISKEGEESLVHVVA